MSQKNFTSYGDMETLVTELVDKCGPAKNSAFDPTGTDLESTNVEDAIKELESNFQDGVDAVYDAVVAKGSTPASHSLSDVVAGIAAIPSGTPPTGTISITANGAGQDVASYAYADVNVPNSNSATFTANSRASSIDMGATNDYRYVNTSGVPNSNSTTYDATIRSSKIDLGANNTYRYLKTNSVPNSNSATYTTTTRENKDLGAANTYRYVNTSNMPNVNSTTYTADTRSAKIDLGAANTYRYLVTSNVPNSNSTTYTYGSGSTGATVNMGSTNTYRYVNATNVYDKGKTDGASGKNTISVANVKSQNFTNSNTDRAISFSAKSGYIYAVAFGGKSGDLSTTIGVTGGTLLGSYIIRNDSKEYTGVVLGIVKATSTTVTCNPNMAFPHVGGVVVMKVAV